MLVSGGLFTNRRLGFGSKGRLVVKNPIGHFDAAVADSEGFNKAGMVLFTFGSRVLTEHVRSF